MLIHTATTARPEMETRVIYTVPGAMMLDSKASAPPTILIRSAFSGTPRLVSLANHGEIVFYQPETRASVKMHIGPNWQQRESPLE